MEILIAGLNGAFVLVMTLVLTWYLRDRFRELWEFQKETRAEMKESRTEIKENRAEMKQDFERLSAKVDNLRSDLTQIALAVGAANKPASA